MERSTVLPMRFGSNVADEAKLQTILDDKEEGKRPLLWRMAVKLAGPCFGQAGGALRETTQSRNHDPTAQKQR